MQPVQRAVGALGTKPSPGLMNAMTGSAQAGTRLSPGMYQNAQGQRYNSPNGVQHQPMQSSQWQKSQPGMGPNDGMNNPSGMDPMNMPRLGGGLQAPMQGNPPMQTLPYSPPQGINPMQPMQQGFGGQMVNAGATPQQIPSSPMSFNQWQSSQQRR